MRTFPTFSFLTVLIAGAMAPALATEAPDTQLNLQGGISQIRHHSLKSFNAPRDRAPGARSDSDIEQDIAAALKADAGIKGTIRVASNRGVVALTGMVEDTGMVYRIISIVENVDGVVGTNEDGLDTI